MAQLLEREEKLLKHFLKGLLRFYCVKFQMSHSYTTEEILDCLPNGKIRKIRMAFLQPIVICKQNEQDNYGEKKPDIAYLYHKLVKLWKKYKKFMSI